MKKKLPKTKQPDSKAQSHNIFISHYYLFGFICIVLLGSIICSNSFECSFHFDDSANIVSNPDIKSLDLKTVWNYSHNRFLPYYTFALNYHFNEVNVWGYHLVNLIIHLLNALLVWWLTLLVFSSPNIRNYPFFKQKNSVAILVALLFVSHPLATQSVTYIVQRIASLAALFYFLSTALYLQGRLLNKGNVSKYFCFAGSLLAGVCALLSKENAYTLPFSIVLAEVLLFRQKMARINLKDYHFYMLLLALIGFVLLMTYLFSFDVLKPLEPDQYNGFRVVTPMNYLFTQFNVIVKYIQLLILPISQNLDYDFPLSNSFFELKTLLCFLFLSSLFVAAFILYDKNRIVSFGIMWFFITLSVESSIIPISDLIFEHRTYIPSFGFFIILATLIIHYLWDKNKNIALAVSAFIILFNSFLTIERNKVWENESTLWTDVLEKSPNSARALCNLGNAAMNENKNEQAILYLNKSIQLMPGFFESYYNRAIVFLNTKKYDAALIDLNKAIELKPYHASSHFNRARVFDIQGKPDEALIDYNETIKLNPNHAKAYNYRGFLYTSQNKLDDAVKDFNKAISLEPRFAEAYNYRGNIYCRQKKFDEALKDYNLAIEFKPDFHEAYNNLGSLYGFENKYQDALNSFDKAVELKPDYGNALFNRGLTKMKLGQKDGACSDMQKSAQAGYQPAIGFYKENCK